MPTVAAAVLAGCSPFLAQWLFPLAQGTPSITAIHALCFAALTVIARTVFQVMIGLLHAAQRFPTASALQTAWFYTTQLSLLGISYFTHNLAALSAGITAASILSLIVAWLSVRRHYTLPAPTWRIPSTIRNRILKTTWHIGTTNIANTIFVQGDKLVVGALLAPSLLGIYSTFTQVVAQINTLSAAACQPLLAHISRIDPREQHSIQTAFMRATLICTACVTLLASGLILMIDPIVAVLFPTISHEYYFILVILTLAYAFFSLNAPAYFTLQALLATSLVRNVTLAASGLSLVTIGFLSYFMGIKGAALGNFAFSGTLLLIPLAARRIKLSLPYMTMLIGSVPVLSIATLLWWLDFNLLVRLVAFIVFLGFISLLVLILYRRRSSLAASRLSPHETSTNLL